MGGTRLFRIWCGMRNRTGNQNDPAYPRYGGRGIKLCVRWQKFEGFMEDMLASYNAHAKKHGEKNTSIDRKDNDKGYFPKNCRWATRSVQNSNKKGTKFYTKGDITDTLSGWATRLGITPTTLQYRLRLWPNDEALTPKSPTKTWKHRKSCEKFPKP